MSDFDVSLPEQFRRAWAEGFHAQEAPDRNAFSGRDPYDTGAIERWRERERLAREWRLGPWWEKTPEDRPSGIPETPPNAAEPLARIREMLRGL
jgi:hypothetical protein